MKKSLIILSVILIVVGLAVYICAFAAAGFDIHALSTVAFETNTYTVSESFDSIRIDTDESDVTFKPSEDGKCSVVCYEKDKVKHTASVENGTLTIGDQDRRAWYDYLTFSFRSPSVTVYLPSNSYRSLTVDSGTGSVAIPAGFTFDSVDIDLSTGTVDCACTVKGALKIDTSTGSIRLSGVSAGSIDISVSTGSVKLTDTVASGSLSIDASTGSVRFDNCDAGEITVDTSTGSVQGTLRTPKIFYAKTSTGSVSVPDTLTGGKCSITTSTGSINITLVGQE